MTIDTICLWTEYSAFPIHSARRRKAAEGEPVEGREPDQSSISTSVRSRLCWGALLRINQAVGAITRTIPSKEIKLTERRQNNTSKPRPNMICDRATTEIRDA